jgi:hypothetical protein
MDDLFLTINPDILEILLSEVHQVSCVLNGMLSAALRHITVNHYGGISYYCTERLFKHGTLQALDPELLEVFADKLYIPDDEWKKAIISAPDKIKIKGVNMDYVKYSHIDFNLLEYNNYLYNKLEKQTQMFNPVELGKRIILLPGDIPRHFDGIIKLYEPLTEEFKLIAKFLKRAYEIEIEIKDSEAMSQVLDEVFGPCTPQQLELFKQQIVEFMSPERDPLGLSINDLEKYREKYEACIRVTPENGRLYTRARFLLNIFVELNEHVIKHVVSSAKTNFEDTVPHAYEYLGMTASNILKHFHTLYLDDDNYPLFSDLYQFGSIENRQFPESSVYTHIQQQCYCRWCKPFRYTAQLYEANTGEVYVLVNLKVVHPQFFDYIISKKCVYELFLYNMDYHYERLECLDRFRHNLEVMIHRRNATDIHHLHRNYGQFYHNWFSSNYHVQRGVLEAERILQTVKEGCL